MIEIEVNLVPYGRRIYGRHSVLTGTIWSDRDGAGKAIHAYQLIIHRHGTDELPLAGMIEKVRSGHRNPLHLLRSIIEEIGPDEFDALGLNYASTLWDSNDPKADAERQLQLRERIMIATNDAIAAIDKLAGHGSRQALESLSAIEEAVRQARARAEDLIEEHQAQTKDCQANRDAV
jgi:hypothetical protein